MNNEELTKLVLEQKEALQKMQKRTKSLFVGLLFNDVWTLILTTVLIWLVLKSVGFL